MLKTHAHSVVSLILVSVNRYNTVIKIMACRVIAFFWLPHFGRQISNLLLIQLF